MITYKLWEEIVKNFDDEKGQKISGINVLFFDLSKAFDRCWKEGILFKLREAGIYGRTYNQLKLI